MRFSVAAVFSGLVALAAAQDPNAKPFDPIYTPSNFQEVPVGSTIDITWDPQPAIYNQETVKIGLIGGDTQGTQVPLYNIASGVINSAGRFTWTVPATSSGKNFYGIVITLESNSAVYQYSNPFKVVAAPGGVSSTTGTTTGTSTTIGTTIGTTTTTTGTSTTTGTTTTTSVNSQSSGSAASTASSASSASSASTATDVPTMTKVVSLSSVIAATTTTNCPETTPAVSAEAVPTHGYVPAPDSHSNSTVPLTKPATTLSQATVLHTGTSPSVASTPVPTGGAVAQGVSMALVGAFAVLAFAF